MAWPSNKSCAEPRALKSFARNHRPVRVADLVAERRTAGARSCIATRGIWGALARVHFRVMWVPVSAQVFPENLARKRTAITALPCLLALVLTASCTPKTSEIKEPVVAPKAFSATGSGKMSERFWQAFADEKLDALVQSALASNLDLKSSYYRIVEFRAMARKEGAAKIPTLSATVGAQLRHPVPFQNDYLRLGLETSYEVDLWGRIASAQKAAVFRAQASEADWQALRISLAAEVCSTWYQIVEARAQELLLRQQLQTNEALLTMVQSLYDGGQASSVDELRQTQVVSDSKTRTLAVEVEIATLRNRLDQLLGNVPHTLKAQGAGPLPSIPGLPETGIPADLIKRRPDVQSAYLLLQASDRDLASAISNRYPRLSLSAQIGTRGGSGVTLFRDWFATLAANLIAPIIDGGLRRAEVDRVRAITKQRLFAYGQASLVAIREVEDALIREANQAERIRFLEEQVALAKQSYAQLEVEYLNGIATYTDLLTTLSTEQELQRSLLQAQRVAIEFRIALYRALAGGFESEKERQ